MTFEWTKHRFSGGLLALDVANTVVRRNEPARRIDRFSNDRSISEFISAAAKFRANELNSPDAAESLAGSDIAALIDLRESIDVFTRSKVQSGQGSAEALTRLFAAAAKASQGANKAHHSLTFGACVAVSAMKLLDEAVLQRCKICPNCGWLFLDKSKNQSRVWCDMAVCGNRAKAKAHYARVGKIEKRALSLPQ